MEWGETESRWVFEGGFGGKDKNPESYGGGGEGAAEKAETAMVSHCRKLVRIMAFVWTSLNDEWRGRSG